jgi:hypothetical protein
MQAPTVKKVKIYAVVENVLESRANPEELHGYLKSNRFSGTATLTYDANYNQGGVRTIITKEHIPLTEEELDRVLAARNGSK